MPRVYEMSWDGPRGRWVKMYRGQRFTIACSTLNVPPTKDASYQAANAWWQKRQAEVDTTSRPAPRPPLPMEEIVRAFEPEVFTDYKKALAYLGSLAEERQESISRGLSELPWPPLPPEEEMPEGMVPPEVEEDPEPDEAFKSEMISEANAAAAFEFFKRHVWCGRPLPDGMAQRMLPARLRQVQSGIAGLRGESAPQPERTLTKQAERYLATELARGKAPGTYGDLAYYVRKLLTNCPILAGNQDVSAITETAVTDFYSWLRNQSGQAPIVQRKLWNYFRRLVRFLSGENLIPLPRNLGSLTFSFDATAKKIKVYPVDQVRAMLASLPDRLRLYALLALNCGMYGVDMGDLRHDEYRNGRIRRKRTKTRRNENVPEVEYLLWPETKALLDKYPSTHPEYVLTSKTGTPLWRAEIRGGKKVKVDLVGLQWQRGRGEGRATKPPIPLKALRSVSATLLESHEVYGRYKSHFLGHSPNSLADKHYAAPSQELFDRAVAWLGQQLGQVPIPGAKKAGKKARK